MASYKHRFPKLEHRSILSPMSGVTDVAFRTLCKRYGAGLTVTEFVSATALARNSQKSLRMLDVDSSETPVAVQLFGNSEEDVVAAAKLCQKKFDIVDINCGCPAWKVVKCGAGSAMLEDERKIHRFVARLVDETNVPITVKIRIGIDDKRINALSVARLVEDAGASAIAVHGRTQKQGYSGKADWEMIRCVKERASIPIIGNGDVFSPETFKQRLDESGVDYILVARGAIGKPFIFNQINEYLATGVYSVLSNVEQMFCFGEYLTLAKKHNVPFQQAKIHAQSFTTGQTGAAKFRQKLMSIKTMMQLEREMDNYVRLLGKSEHLSANGCDK